MVQILPLLIDLRHSALSTDLAGLIKPSSGLTLAPRFGPTGTTSRCPSPPTVRPGPTATSLPHDSSYKFGPRTEAGRLTLLISWIWKWAVAIRLSLSYRGDGGGVIKLDSRPWSDGEKRKRRKECGGEGGEGGVIRGRNLQGSFTRGDDWIGA